jgi:hypothetical protein
MRVEKENDITNGEHIYRGAVSVHTDRVINRVLALVRAQYLALID